MIQEVQDYILSLKMGLKIFNKTFVDCFRLQIMER